MSEIDTRPASTRGRSSTRGGRGGLSRGGPRGGKRINGTSDFAAIEESFDDQGELGDMKRKYTSQLPVLKDMFADWNDVDLLFALQESDGDLAATVDKISQGNVSQFSEVKKNKDRARSRVKEEPTTAPIDKAVGSIRGRGRGGLEGTRGRGGRGADRGRGGHRGARGGHASTNGAVKDSEGLSVPTAESTAWDTGATEASTSGLDTSATTEPAAPPTAAPAEEKSLGSSIKKTWASMFSLPKPTPAPASRAQPEPPTALAEPEIIPDAPTPAILTEDTHPAILAAAIIDGGTAAEEAQIPPPKNPLTQENVEHLPDESHPPATHTAASTIDSNDPRNLTPLPGQQAPIGRPPLGGFAASAQRAASGSLRSASFQRRVLEQQEAVVMPGHNAVDRATVQFGSMGLNGEPGLDVDDEREDPETRQAPQHSPPSQPKASLPPYLQHGTSTTDADAVDNATKQAPGLPPASQHNVPQLLESSLTQGLQQEQQQHAYSQNQFGGYGQPVTQHDAQAAQQKPYDPFTSQGQHPQYDRFGQPIQAPQQSSQQSHSGFGGLPSGQHDYSSYYGSEQHRNAYNQYYGAQNYGAQDNRGQGQQQDASLGQRVATGYGNEQAYGAQAQQQVSVSFSRVSKADDVKGRYAEGGNSGNTTPNPLMSGQPQSNPAAPQSTHPLHHQQQGQAQHQQQHPYGTNAAGFPYGHPYFNSPYAQAYQNQFGFNGYPAGYTGKTGNMYAAPQGYNMGSQSSYEQHSSSPGNTNAFSQNQQSSLRSASGMSSGLGGTSLDEYGRQTAQTSSHGNTSFGMNDPFARTPSGFGAQGYSGQTTNAGHEDSLKAYDNGKAGSSPAMAQAGRPSSAANNAQATAQATHPQSQAQQSFSGYQGYPAQNNQYGGLGGLGGHQQQAQSQQGQYSGYGASNFSQYGSYNSRGGWGQTYGGGH